MPYDRHCSTCMTHDLYFWTACSLVLEPHLREIIRICILVRRPTRTQCLCKYKYCSTLPRNCAISSKFNYENINFLQLQGDGCTLNLLCPSPYPGNEPHQPLSAPVSRTSSNSGSTSLCLTSKIVYKSNSRS